MKNYFKIILLACVLLSFQCDTDNTQNPTITPEMLNAKKQEILNYIASFSCNNATCMSIALGAKPCGGPQEYLAYPSSVDQNTLQNMVNQYYQMENTYNIQTNAVSDCMAVLPPNTVNCINGTCTIIN